MTKWRYALAALFAVLGAVKTYAVDVSFDGELRTRFCYMMNKDGDFTRSGDFWLWDARGKLGAKIDVNNGFYGYYLLQMGNIIFGDTNTGGAQGATRVNLTTRNLFIGYKSDLLKAKVGIYDFETPLGGEIDDQVPGIDFKFGLAGFRVEAMYAKLYSLLSNTNSIIDIDQFEVKDWHSTHLFYVLGGYELALPSLPFTNNVEAYYMRLNDFRFDYTTHLNWMSLYDSFDMGMVKVEGGVSLNTGSVIVDSNTTIPVAAMYAKAKVEVNLFDIVDVFARFHYATGNAAGDTNTIRQYQTVGAKGDFDSDLGILFGGSPYYQQSYFDSKYIGLDTRRNLTQGSIQILNSYNTNLGFYPQYDPGLVVIEGGVQKKFDSIGLRTKLVFGLGMTANPLYVVADGATNTVRTLGYELDLNNKLKLAKGTYLTVNAAMLLHGDALRSIYSLNTKVLIGSDPTFKFDAEVKMEF